MPKYKLYYFNFRGRAEVIRLVFAAAGQPYEDVRLTKEEWQKEKPKMPFGQLPVLEIDGFLLGQSNAIARLISKSLGLAGKNDLESAQCDMIVDCMDDMGKPLMEIFFCKDEAKKAEMRKKYSEHTLPDFLGRFEKLLISNNNGDGYFVGSGLTWADLSWLHGIQWVPLMGVEIPWDSIPKQKALMDRIENLPKIKEWYQKRPKTDM